MMFSGEIASASKNLLGRFQTWATPRILKYGQKKRLDIYKKALFIKDGKLFIWEYVYKSINSFFA